MWVFLRTITPAINGLAAYRRQLLRAIAPALAIAFLSACAPAIDSSDTDALGDSVKAMSASLTEAQRQQLREALVTIALSEIGYLGEPPADAEQVARDAVLGPALMKALDGEDFADLLERADGLREQKESRTVVAAEQARQDVLARIAQAQTETAAINGLVIAQANYGWTKGDYLPQAFIAFRLANSSGKTINGVKLRGDLYTAEKQQSWLHETLNHEMLRGLQDGDAADYRLVPNQYSPWGNRKLQSRRDTRLQLHIINVKIGDVWMVSADLEALDKELKSYEAAVAKSRAIISEIKARRAK